MNYSKLEKNIIDSIEEQQLKLGYLEETVRLYYPLSSLKRFLDMDCPEIDKCSIEEMQAVLQDFSKKTREHLGGVLITNKGERFCIAVPPKGAEYIHKNLNENGFLAELVCAVGKHGCTLEYVLDIFHRYSEHVHVESMSNGEFDYLVYFENNQPDDYRYCISVEAQHVICHRYTPEDDREIGF